MLQTVRVIALLLILSSISIHTDAEEKMESTPGLPCLANICLGDDVNSLKVNFLTREEATKKGFLPSKNQQPREDPAVRELFEQGFIQGLQSGEMQTLRPYFAIQFFDKKILQLLELKQPVFCKSFPLRGIFVSESGHLTSVYVLPDTDKRWKVVEIIRKFNVLNVIDGEALIKKLKEAYPEWDVRSDGGTIVYFFNADSNPPPLQLTLTHPALQYEAHEGWIGLLSLWGKEFPELKERHRRQGDTRYDGPTPRVDDILKNQKSCQKDVQIN